MNYLSRSLIRAIRSLLLTPLIPAEAPLPTTNRRQRGTTLVMLLIAACTMWALSTAPASWHDYSPSTLYLLTLASCALVADSLAKVANIDEPFYIEFSALLRNVVVVFAGADLRLIAVMAVARALMTLRIFVRDARPPADGWWIGAFNGAAGAVQMCAFVALSHFAFDHIGHAFGALWLVGLLVMFGSTFLDVLFNVPMFVIAADAPPKDAQTEDSSGNEAIIHELRSLVFNVPLFVIASIAIQDEPWSIVGLIAPAILLAVMSRPVEQLALAEKQLATDWLTGIPNRQSFWRALDAAVSRSDRTGETFAVAMFDIDNFKTLNDTKGHLEGDEALRAFARALEGSVRPYDTAARLGGEEFGVVVANVTLEQATALLDRIHAAVNGALAPWGTTASVGVHLRERGGMTGEPLLDRADQALYSSKRTGKDRVTFL